MLKRCFDIFASLIGFIIMLPFLVLVFLIIWIVDGMPIIFVQSRVGLNGKIFNLYKFRTMSNSEDRDNRLATSTDSRITKLGKFLRYYKIDEFPQLLNVLYGDMSFVGYRPEIPYYVNKYTAEQKEILKYKPGIIDPATLKFSRLENEILSKSINAENDYVEKILPIKLKLSLNYAKQATFLSDIKLLIKCLIG